MKGSKGGFVQPSGFSVISLRYSPLPSTLLSSSPLPSLLLSLSLRPIPIPIPIP